MFMQNRFNGSQLGFGGARPSMGGRGDYTRPVNSQLSNPEMQQPQGLLGGNFQAAGASNVPPPVAQPPVAQPYSPATAQQAVTNAVNGYMAANQNPALQSGGMSQTQPMMLQGLGGGQGIGAPPYGTQAANMGIGQGIGGAGIGSMSQSMMAQQNPGMQPLLQQPINTQAFNAAVGNYGFNPQAMQAMSQGTAQDKANWYAKMQNAGYDDATIRANAQNVLGQQSDTDWSYLQRLAGQPQQQANPGNVSATMPMGSGMSPDVQRALSMMQGY